MKITVIGMGYVGLVTACGLASFGHQVLGVEKNHSKLKKLMQFESPIYEQGLDELLNKAAAEGDIQFTTELNGADGSDLIFITVGTPSTNSGHVDLSQVYTVINQLVHIITKPTILVMKSTVPPGTGEKIIRRFLNKCKTEVNYISNPEFLREGKALLDWFYPDRIVIGGKNNDSIQQVKNIYKKINAPKLVMGITSAEMVKYASNAFLATKISFINEIANICDLLGADIDEVAPAVGMDKRIGSDFLRAGLGYGGSCFPKDTKGLNFISTLHGYNFNLLKAVIEVNFQQRLKAVHKLHTMLGGLAGKKIAVMGLTFKPGTDDVRESPALDILSLLASEGAVVKACDPHGKDNASKYFSRKIIFCEDAYECAKGVQAVLLNTEWPQFIHLNWSIIKQTMQTPYFVYDGRNALDKKRLSKLGFKYCGVGRPCN